MEAGEIDRQEGKLEKETETRTWTERRFKPRMGIRVS